MGGGGPSVECGNHLLLSMSSTSYQFVGVKF